MILLLVLSLILTGCEAEREIEACVGGWFEFTCKYSIQNGPTIEALKKKLKSTVVDKWEENKNIFMYHNKSGKLLRVIVKNLKKDDSGDYKCKNPKGSKTNLELEVKNDGCRKNLHQTAYATAKTTVTCKYDKKNRESYFCKDNGFDCTEIFPERFTLTKIEGGLNVSISDVSSQDSGVYWCGVKSADYKRSIRRIQLEVQNITSDTRSATVGETLTYMCDFSKNNFIKKFVCKGEDPSLCERLASGKISTNERFSLKEDNSKLNISFTMTDLRTDDSGTYWCGAETSDKARSDVFVHRLVMTVVSEPRLITIPPVHETTRSLTSEKTTTAPDKNQGCDGSKNTTHGGAQNEDHNYAEIEERPQKPDLGTAAKTVYVTANFPTKVSASHYLNVLFEKSPVGVSSDTCSTVGGSVEGPTYSTVNHPSSFTEKPLYSTINFHVNQQQH
ncbi:polymeric immunoglobulin receptor-like isoform X2 [Paralichthys olivaceus]|uniref:polymeric immunoglobulin receptor-like isoform X2 n=1 Tax=Paralichthys olivaceus TaxID=8255 RepID=UPI003751D1FC